ncbi:MAG: OmpH family outer membrane protein [Bacteroidota bacterium]
MTTRMYAAGALAALFLGATTLVAQVPKVAFVDSEIIMRDFSEAQKAQKELQDIIKRWQDELERMGQELQRGLEEYQQKQTLLAPQKKQEEEQRLGSLQQKAREFQVQKFDNRTGEIVQVQEQKMGPVRKTILETIEAVAKEDGFHYVFDKANDLLLLYADPKFDLTYKVLDRLKRGPSATRPN